jgi:serine/threonine protein phosphatase PrpC
MAENFFGSTDTGKLRDNNEDTFIAEKLSNGWIVACVIDGVGGYEGGEVAAEIARTTILNRLQQPFEDVIATLQESLLLTNQNIYNEKIAGNGNKQMACVLTLALVDIEANQFYYAHVGDTRLYLLRDGSLVKVTKDHSFVGFLEDSGRLSEKEAMTHPKRNEINKALGFDAQIEIRSDYVETGSSPFLPGDMLLLCSDGLTDLVNNSEMSSMLLSAKSLGQKAQALIEAANKAGGKDNITVVIVSNDKKPLKQKAFKPLTAKKNENNEEIAVVNVEQTAPHAVNRPKKKGGGVIWLLIFLCLLLAGVCYWLWTKNMELTKPVQPVVQKGLNASEKTLGDSISITPGMITLSDSVFGSSIMLSDTIFIRQDSLHINGNGIVLQRDSSYNGPAFFVTANSNYLFLENIIFKDFSTAVLIQGKGLQLKNVVFQNAVIPVQQNLMLPVNDSLTGIINNSFINQKDSLPQ